MEEESFIDAFGDVPTDLAGDYSQLYIFRTEDFGAWYRRVRDAHEREVDALRDSMAEPDWDDQAALDHLTDAQLAEHGLVRKDKEHIISHVTVEVTPHIDWSRMADELDEFVEIVRGIAGGVE